MIPCIPIDKEIGILAGKYIKQYAKSHPVELADAPIAAIVSAHKVELWTRNRKRYP